MAGSSDRVILDSVTSAGRSNKQDIGLEAVVSSLCRATSMKTASLLIFYCSAYEGKNMRGRHQMGSSNQSKLILMKTGKQFA